LDFQPKNLQILVAALVILETHFLLNKFSWRFRFKYQIAHNFKIVADKMIYWIYLATDLRFPHFCSLYRKGMKSTNVRKLVSTFDLCKINVIRI
jgi:hypothetical protein